MNIHGNNVTVDSKRAELADLTKQFQYFTQFPLLLKFLDSVPIPVLVLNRQRQAVYSNKALFKLTGNQDLHFIYGMRPGEILNCAHAFEVDGGCGCSESCSTCGALNAIVSTHHNLPDVQECRILKKDNEALDLKVHASPLKIGSEIFTVFALTDISDEKRRLNLERIFFHDLLNTASTVKALAYNLESANKEESEEFRGYLVKLTDKLVDEICAQRDIYAAENNELAVYLSIVNSLVLLNDMYEHFNHIAEGKTIVIDNDTDTFDFLTDKVLIRRILTNMVKNALEASDPGNIITMGCRKSGLYAEIWVHNQSFIEKKVQLQIFQRSFTTKGFGRGIGTYSMKLLCEKYLKGKVTFKSSKEGGTTFYCTIPLNLD